MSNLRNSDLRARDVFRLAGYKFASLRWDKGCDESNEWVMASTAEEKHRQSLIGWLLSKKIDPNTDVVAVTLVNDPVLRYKWGEIQASPENVFNGAPTTLYEIDFMWQLEYAEQEVARFGRYQNA